METSYVTPNLLAQLVLYLWFPLVISFLFIFPIRKAIIIAYIVGELFIPKSLVFKLPLIPSYAEDTATSYALLTGIIILTLTKTIDSRQLKEFKFKSIDIPIVCVCLSPFFSSLTNGLGLHDAISGVLNVFFTFAISYFLGRIYLGNLGGLKELCLNIIKGGILYIPLCLYEIKMGPFLHAQLYGYSAHSSGFMQALRMGGWRPQVFMTHGLVVALWMVSATMTILWLYQSKTIMKIWYLDIKWLTAIMFFTFILLKSTGAYIYLVYYLIIFIFSRYLKSNIPAWFLVCFLIIFLLGRSTLILSEPLVNSYVAKYSSADRNQSYDFRLINEDIMTKHAWEKPIFGWGSHGRNMIRSKDEYTGEYSGVTVVDSLWIIEFGTNGFFGLISFYSFFILPIILFLRRFKPREWFNSGLAPVACLSMVLLVFVWDSTANAGIMSIFPLICGSLNGILSRKPVVKLSKKSFNNKPSMIRRNRVT